MDNLNAFNTILEYNYRFGEYILHECPCYETEYQDVDFNDVCINNKSYLACIVVKKGGLAKILHLKLPIVFGSLIDYTIRKGRVFNYNQFGCLYLDGTVKVIYNFNSNNLTAGHVYANDKKNTLIFKVAVENETHAMNLVYNPKSDDDPIKVSITNIKMDKREKLENQIKTMEQLVHKDQTYDSAQPPSKKQKTSKYSKTGVKKKNKNQKKLERLMKEYEKYETTLKTNDKVYTWLSMMNEAGSRLISHVSEGTYEFKKKDYFDVFNAFIECAPKLDDVSNKVSRTETYIMYRALTHNIDMCFASDPDMKNLGQKLYTTFKNGNMFFTLAQYIMESRLTNGFKAIWQNIEAQKINQGAMMTSTIKRSVNDSIKNSKALLYSRDGYWFICTIDSREMKGAGENVMLGQLVIIPIALDVKKVVSFIVENKQTLDIEGSKRRLQCVVNSFLQDFYVDATKLMNLKNRFKTISLMVFKSYLVINTNGYNQMKYSVKYDCFITPFEFNNIWPDAFDNYHPHLGYNSGAMFLPESAELALPAKLTVANANVKGACMNINSVFELNLFIHTNGASNAGLIHRYIRGDTTVLLSFDGKKHEGDFQIYIPIELKDSHMRYSKISTQRLDKDEIVPASIRCVFDIFKPIYDYTEANGMRMVDLLDNAKGTFDRIYNIMYDLYDMKERLEFVNVNEKKLIKTDKPLLVNDDDEGTEREQQVVYDTNLYNIKCFKRSNENIMESYKRMLTFDVDKNHPPQMYVPVAFGDIEGGTNEDGIVIDEKLVKYGPRKLISQTLKITFKYDNKKDNPNISYIKCGKIINNEIIFGKVHSFTPISFSTTKNTKVSAIYIPPSNYEYTISVKNASEYEKYISSTFHRKTNCINIHFSYTVPLGVGTKLSTGHGQKGVVCKVADLSSVQGYTRHGTKVHPLILFSPTSVLGRIMASQVYSMFCQPDMALTTDGVLIAPHGVNIHNIEPSSKTKLSEVKNDLMTTENGNLYNETPFTMQVLSRQSIRQKKEEKIEYLSSILNLQGVQLNMLAVDPAAVLYSLSNP
nr:LEF-8 [Menippe mercenaria nudivirus]